MYMHHNDQRQFGFPGLYSRPPRSRPTSLRLLVRKGLT